MNATMNTKSEGSVSARNCEGKHQTEMQPEDQRMVKTVAKSYLIKQLIQKNAAEVKFQIHEEINTLINLLRERELHLCLTVDDLSINSCEDIDMHTARVIHESEKLAELKAQPVPDDWDYVEEITKCNELRLSFLLDDLSIPARKLDLISDFEKMRDAIQYFGRVNTDSLNCNQLVNEYQSQIKTRFFPKFREEWTLMEDSSFVEKQKEDSEALAECMDILLNSNPYESYPQIGPLTKSRKEWTPVVSRLSPEEQKESETMNFDPAIEILSINQENKQSSAYCNKEVKEDPSADLLSSFKVYFTNNVSEWLAPKSGSSKSVPPKVDEDFQKWLCPRNNSNESSSSTKSYSNWLHSEDNSINWLYSKDDASSQLHSEDDSKLNWLYSDEEASSSREKLPSESNWLVFEKYSTSQHHLKDDVSKWLYSERNLNENSINSSLSKSSKENVFWLN